MPTASLAAVTPAAKDSFTISELAAEFDVTPRTIRFYEAERLIAPERDGAESHLFEARPAQGSAGSCAASGSASASRRSPSFSTCMTAPGRRSSTEALAERVQARIAALEAQRRDLDATIDELKQFTATISTTAAARPLSHSEGPSMPSYTAPVRDTQFVLDEVINLQKYANLPGFSEASRR